MAGIVYKAMGSITVGMDRDGAGGDDPGVASHFGTVM